DLVEVRDRTLQRHVVVEAFPGRATNASDRAVAPELTRVLTAAAFNVTTQDVDVLENVRTDAGLVEGRRSRDIARRAADRGAFRRRQQRVAAAQSVGVAEVARRSDLRHRLIVREHQLGVELGARAEVVRAERAERIALIRTLEVVRRLEVVLVEVAVEVTERV